MAGETPKPVEDMTIDECKEEVKRIGEEFEEVAWDPGQLYNVPIVIASQQNAIGQLLVKKGIFTQEEIDTEYFRLLCKRYREHEEIHLPQVKKQREKERMQQIVATQQMMREAGLDNGGKSSRS